MQHIYRHFTIAGGLLLLAACGGGAPVSEIPLPADNSAPSNLASKESLPVDNSVPPNLASDLTSDEIGAKFSDLDKAADSLLLSDYLVFSQSVQPERFDVSCSSSGKCDVALGRGLTMTVRSSFLVGNNAIFNVGTKYKAVGKHNGIPLFRGRGQMGIIDRSENVPVVGYGGWLDHGYFVVNTGVAGEPAQVVSYSKGEASGTNPDPSGGSGTWTGVMVGSDASQPPKRFNFIRGDAKITIDDFSKPELDIAFTKIQDRDARKNHDDMKWTNVKMENGEFKEKESNRDSIQGRFYGPKHNEVSGVFERDQIIGAFGAKRQ